jgi:hypothetical protein
MWYCGAEIVRDDESGRRRISLDITWTYCRLTGKLNTLAPISDNAVLRQLKTRLRRNVMIDVRRVPAYAVD